MVTKSASRNFFRRTTRSSIVYSYVGGGWSAFTFHSKVESVVDGGCFLIITSTKKGCIEEEVKGVCAMEVEECHYRAAQCVHDRNERDLVMCVV